MTVDLSDAALMAGLRAKVEALGNEVTAWQTRAQKAMGLCKHAQAELKALRESLEAEADAADVDPEHEAKASSFWYAAWKERNRQRAEDKRRITALERELEELRCLDLISFLDGELSSARHTAFQAHLARCTECQQGLVSHGQVDALMSELAPPRTPRET